MFEIKADENCCASRERGATVIVGAGTAGMSAAIELARHGVASTVVDESPKIGGVVYRGPLRMQGSCSHLDRKFKKTINAIQPDYEEFSSHINIKLNTQVLGAIDDNRRLALLDSERFYSIDYSRLIVATGCHERGVPFPGWTLPGVMTVGGAQLQVKSGLVKPGRRIALVGTGPLLLVAAKQLHLAGVEVIGVYESGRWLDLALNGLSLLSSLSLVAEGIGYRRFLKKAGIPFRYSWGLVEARGGRELEEVILAPLDRQWRPKKSQRETVAVDCLAVEYGFQSRSQLTQLLGMDHEFDESSGWRPVHDESGRTARVGTYVAGDAAGVFGGQVAAQQGKLAALAVLQDRGFSDRARVQREVGSVRKMLQKHMRFREAFTKFSRLRPGLLDLPAEDTVICRCENVTRAKIDRVLQQGVTDITTLKLETRAGMGDCQGKMCSSFCYDYMKRKLDTDDVGRLRPRFPLAPLIFGDMVKGEKTA